MNIKVCGMKYPENMLSVASLQPAYMGFIFWEPSSRFFQGEIPKDIPENIIKTGVFVDESIAFILKKVMQYNLKAIQLHGKESDVFCASLKKSLKNKLPYAPEIIKVFSVKKHFDFAELGSYEPYCDYFLFDTKGKLPGGNGYTFDWSLLKSYPSSKPYFLSGGIGINEINKLERFLSDPMASLCHAIDVNSKFEIAPGLKDLKLLNSFINTLKDKKN